MIQVLSPTLEPFYTAENVAEDVKSFTANQLDEAIAFYDENGFVVIREILNKFDCINIKNIYQSKIKSFKGPLPRINGKQELNTLNNKGFITNPIMNIHLFPNNLIKEYIEKTLLLLTDKKLNELNSKLLGGSDIRLLTWNQFEANPVTIPHHDCFFWGDDLSFREVVGLWIALEDINPGAGRLYVYPGSHKVNFKDFADVNHLHENSLQPNDLQYQQLIHQFLVSNDLICTAPYLQPGDVIFWDARTIHGSLYTTSPSHSRTSLTSHFSLNTGRIFPKGVKQKRINGVLIQQPNLNFKKVLSGAIPILRKRCCAIKNLFQPSK